MGVKYTSQSSSGYDSGSPPDDGTQSEDNKCKWSVIKSSLTDVLETFSDAINTELLAFFDFNTNAQPGNYTTLTSDNGKTIECTGSGTITLGAAATMTTGYEVTVKCVSGTETVATSDEIDGSASNRTLAAGSSETYVVNSAADKYLIKSENIGTTETIYSIAISSAGVGSNLPSGWTTDKNGTGDYTVTHGLTSQDVVLCSTADSLFSRIATASSDSVDTFRVKTWTDAGVAADIPVFLRATFY